jgi:hypothetical protein
VSHAFPDHRQIFRSVPRYESASRNARPGSNSEDNLQSRCEHEFSLVSCPVSGRAGTGNRPRNWWKCVSGLPRLEKGMFDTVRSRGCQQALDCLVLRESSKLSKVS